MIVPRIRAIAKELDVIVGILMDTQGPAIRTGDLPTKLDLKVGDVFEFTVRGTVSEEMNSVGVNYDGLIDDISVGDTVLVDNGVIHMKVLAKEGSRIRCEVLTSGIMGSRRHINLPGVKVNLPPLTEKDLADIAVGTELHVDFVALSFCREPGDVEELRKVLRSHDSSARIVASWKIRARSRTSTRSSRLPTWSWSRAATWDRVPDGRAADHPAANRQTPDAACRIVATHMLSR